MKLTNLHSVAHHGHFMESWLSVENNQVTICDMPFHLVTTLQMEVRGFGVIPQVNTCSIITDDVFGTGILVVSSLYKFHHSRNLFLFIIYK